MSILRRLLSTEQRNVSGGQWLSDKPADSSAGVQLNQQNATSIGALYAAVKLYADTVASLPVGAFIRDGGVRRPVTRPLWLERPIPGNPNYTGFQMRHAIVSSLLLDGNAFILFLTGRSGEVVETRVLDPQKVTVTQNEMGEPLYHIKTTNGDSVLGADSIVHITLFGTGENLRGMSPIEHHKVTLGLAAATQIFSAKFYENNASVGGVVKVLGELTQDQADALRNGFGRRHDGVKNAFKVAVLTGGADFQQLGAKVSDLQLVETMHYSVESIARLYGIPLHMLQVPGGNTSYASVELIGIEWLRLGLGPLIARLEAGFQRLVPGSQQTFLKFTLDGLLRATTQERYNSYSTALNNGFLSLNEVRGLEDRSPIGPAGDEYWKPLNIGVVGQDPQA